MNDDDDDGNVP